MSLHERLPFGTGPDGAPAEPPGDPVARLPLGPRPFAVLARLAREAAGLHLPPAKRDLVHARLVGRVRALGLPGWDAYCERLEGPDGADERRVMLEALTTNVTRFFREEHHFRLLRERVLPPLVERARAGGRVRLWSAGCSTGQEAWSLAFLVLDLCPEAARLDVAILATDVDGAVLAEAERGAYGAEEAAAVPPPLRRFLARAEPQEGPAEGPPGADAPARAHFGGQMHAFAGPGEARVLVRPGPRRLVAFRRLNLVGRWPLRGPFDAILCRNVAIYFDRPTQARLWARFAALLPPGGVLLIGHSERLSGPAEALFGSMGVTAHRRLPGPCPCPGREAGFPPDASPEGRSP